MPINQPESKRKHLHFNKMIPNILTLLALSAGMTAIRFALADKWEFAAMAIMVAALLDGLDGRIARILKGASKFGAELDSLSDFLCFGVAPALMLYLWTMQSAGRFGWALVLFFPVCSSLRLARFNTALEDPNKPAWASNFFTGVPSPAGAGLVLLPLVLSFQFGDDFFRSPGLVTTFLIGVGALLVSPVPTFSFKKFKVAPGWILPTMLLVGILAAMILSAPWLTLSVLLIIYIGTIPFSVRTHRKLVEENGSIVEDEDILKMDDETD